MECMCFWTCSRKIGSFPRQGCTLFVLSLHRAHQDLTEPLVILDLVDFRAPLDLLDLQEQRVQL